MRVPYVSYTHMFSDMSKITWYDRVGAKTLWAFPTRGY